MAQDILVTNMSAAFSQATSANANTADTRQAMVKRIVDTFGKFQTPPAEAAAFGQAVQTLGMAAYAHAQFPDKFPAPKPAE
jgi:cytochrome c556